MQTAKRVALPFGIGTPETKRDSYRRALLAVGVEPVEDVSSLASVGGLLLAGGTDVDPALYGESRQAQTDEPDAVRDALESSLLREALQRDLPVFGICRGLQLLNAALGGTLIQHVDGHKRPKEREVHSVSIAPASRLASILSAPEYIVNSRHHQCAGRVADGLLVAATAPDGVIEALEVPGKRFALAVQWHPEARMDGPDRKLFEAFASALEA
jgi:gamma-glutamyl-gamma-aminobutyrate hydrolase PuuD